jgi:uncharacterized cupin superfamily protein
VTNYLTFPPGSAAASVEPEYGVPAPGRLISGDPQFTSWNLEEAEGGIYAGIWQSTPGKWRVEYDEWEYFHILEGHAVLTEDGGEPLHLKAGDRMTIRPGFKGVW